MGNHEYPCEVCGKNKFSALFPHDEYHHKISELIQAKQRLIKNNQTHYYIDEVINFQLKISKGTKKQKIKK